MILLIDNYDSFVYNLARLVRELGYSCRVIRNDKISLAEIAALQPSHIIISPGPGTPKQAGISLAVIKQFAAIIPILGVCLGHQAIAEVYGSQIIKALQPMHGKSSQIHHNGQGVFRGLASPLQAARYHSLIATPPVASELIITATTEQGEIMGVQHRHYPLFGVQFHPESILTPEGTNIMRNFLSASLCLSTQKQ